MNFTFDLPQSTSQFAATLPLTRCANATAFKSWRSSSNPSAGAGEFTPVRAGTAPSGIIALFSSILCESSLTMGCTKAG